MKSLSNLTVLELFIERYAQHLYCQHFDDPPTLRPQIWKYTWVCFLCII